MENQEKTIEKSSVKYLDLQQQVKDLLEQTNALRKEITLLKEENLKKESNKTISFSEALKTIRGLKK